MRTTAAIMRLRAALSVLLALAAGVAGCAPTTPAAVDHAANATVYAAQSGAEAMRARVLRAAEQTAQAPTRTPRPTARPPETATAIPTHTPLPTLLPEPTWEPTSTPPATVTATATSTPRATDAPTATPAPDPTARVIVPTVVVTVVTIRRDGEPLPDWAVAAVFALMLLCFAGAAWVLFGKYRNGR